MEHKNLFAEQQISKIVKLVAVPCLLSNSDAAVAEEACLLIQKVFSKSGCCCELPSKAYDRLIELLSYKNLRLPAVKALANVLQ